jgi:hypothetical protein
MVKKPKIEPNTLYDLSKEYLDLCAKLLTLLGFSVEKNVAREIGGRIRAIDILARSVNSPVFCAELKLALSPNASLESMREWGSQTAALRFESSQRNPLLIVSSQIEQSRKDYIAKLFNIDIWDKDYLLAKASNTPLAQRFRALFLSLDNIINKYAKRSGFPVEPQQSYSVNSLAERPRQAIGNALISQLTSIMPGKAGAKDYENICLDIINYLFGDSLLDPRQQAGLEDHLSFIDIIYQINPNHMFWQTLTRDFRARVIVFECKNYSEPITPMQVYTTERYISIAALRPICFILSRTPPHEHAFYAAMGAMRESAKLLIFLGDEDLKSMIRIRDAQIIEQPDSKKWAENDPTIVLDQKIYDFLARLPR